MKILTSMDKMFIVEHVVVSCLAEVAIIQNTSYTDMTAVNCSLQMQCRLKKIPG